MHMIFFTVKLNKLGIKLQTNGFKDCFQLIDNLGGKNFSAVFGYKYQVDV